MSYPYPGQSPSNPNKDAKYSVVSSPNGGWEVRLIYRVSAREEALLTTDRHEKLVGMVNGVKLEQNGKPGGAFYINEFHDVLVPHPGGGCIHAGTYHELLKFDFDGHEISPVPPPDLVPGDRWPGPHVGILYILAAGGTDIRYNIMTRQRRRKEILSDSVGLDAARTLAGRLARVKGHRGGRIYINEAAEFFTPMDGGESGLSYIYLGSLGDDAWFPAPDVRGRE
ncbi:hypothetical protein [Micromonospora sp. L32]|uniref:hypothetical protein n=1 Tax=Micromonospora sp. L32 TaxID=3452214 RepID=UPI003F8940E2